MRGLGRVLGWGLIGGATAVGAAQGTAGSGVGVTGGVMSGSPAQSAPAVSAHTPEIARISGGVMAGQILTRVNPSYPADAKAAGITGAVVLRAIIAKSGVIENLTVLSGPEMLRKSAVDAVSRWVYKPYLLNGEPTEVDTAITVNYTMTKPPMPAATDGDGDGPALPPEAGDDISGPGLVVPPGTARISGGVMAGAIVKKVAPSYPEEAKAKGISGTVVMHAIIGKDGAISMLSVISGPVELRKSALDAVKKWRYRPYMLLGKPTDVDTTITVNYSMGW